MKTKIVVVVSPLSDLATTLGELMDHEGHETYVLSSAKRLGELPVGSRPSLLLVAPAQAMPHAVREANHASSHPACRGTPWIILHSAPEPPGHGGWHAWVQTPCSVEEILLRVNEALAVKAGS